MRILYIDYMSPKGHEVFNTIHIDSLINIGCNLHVVVYGQYLKNLKEGERLKITRIPECFETKGRSAIAVRINDIRRLLWINKNIDVSIYDSVILSSYDILSLFFFRFKNDIHLLNHNNVDQFDSKIKLFLTKHLPSYYKHVALNEYMMEKLKDALPGKSIEYVPHGYLLPPANKKRPVFIHNGDRFIFCPVNRNYNSSLMKTVVESDAFNEYLKKNNLKLFVKSQLATESMLSNTQMLGRLDDGEYNYMLSNAIAVLLPYGDEFRYRCSGILFECIARDTPIIATPREALKIYKDKINIVFFDNINGLIESINTVLGKKALKYNIEAYNPMNYWKELLNK